MAAVLCKGCSTACGECCKLLTIPCKIFGECCSSVTEGIAQLCTNPFCFFVATTLAISIPSISSSILPIMTYGLGCQASIFLLGNITFCAINILAAFYIAIRFNELKNNPAQSSSGGSTHNSGIKKATDILCYDPFVAIYILILLVFFVWLGMGVNWRATGAMNCADDGSNTLTLVGTTLGLGYTFFSLGFMALCFSLCCSCCCNGDNRGRASNPYYRNQQYGSTSGQTQNNSRPSSNNGTYDNNDVEYAAASATPVTAFPVSDSPKKSSFFSSSTTTTTAPVQATLVEPSAPPLSENEDASAAASGSKIGSKMGQMFNTKPETQKKMESAGARTGVALNQVMKKARNLMDMKK